MSVAGRRLKRLHLGIAAITAVVGIAAWSAAPTPAEARVFVDVGVGVPFPGFYSPYPYYPYPPVAYPYYPPPPPYYPPAGAGYYPPAVPAPAAATAAAAPASITYTNRPAFTNTAGQICREYKSSTGVTGTACQDGTGQWRAAN
jgi:hypothetical protein